MRKIEHDIESTVEFAHCRVEIRNYNWRGEWNGLHCAFPEMYIFELNLSQSKTALPKSHFEHEAPVSFQTGDVAFILPHRIVRRNLAAGWRRALLCMYDRDWLDNLLPQLSRAGGSRAGQAVGIARIEWLLRNIYQEMSQKEDFGSAIVVESFANALAVELARRLLRSNESGLQKGGLGPRRMRLMDERIFSDIAAPSLLELAELCGMTVRHLCRAFKAETGTTPGRYIETARAGHARRLLSQTNLSQGEIARRLGFATSSSFATAFQRATGLKPRQIERPKPQPSFATSKRLL